MTSLMYKVLLSFVSTVFFVCTFQHLHGILKRFKLHGIKLNSIKYTDLDLVVKLSKYANALVRQNFLFSQRCICRATCSVFVRLVLKKNVYVQEIV